MAKLIYNEGFYKSQSAASRRSASVVVPLLLNLIHPTSVVDIGCGVGTWLSVFREHGVVDILGVDGEYARQRLMIPEDHFLSMDLSSPHTLPNRKFDLALCLEVAEHLPKRSAEELIRFITELAPAVFFSAAVPGQGGAGHVNEQWQDYWCERFAKADYQVYDIIRPKIWDNAQVEPWYCQNAFIFIQSSQEKHYPQLCANSSRSELPLRLIHPELFRRFVSLEYVQSKQMVSELLNRVKTRILHQTRWA